MVDIKKGKRKGKAIWTALLLTAWIVILSCRTPAQTIFAQTAVPAQTVFAQTAVPAQTVFAQAAVPAQTLVSAQTSETAVSAQTLKAAVSAQTLKAAVPEHTSKTAVSAVPFFSRDDIRPARIDLPGIDISKIDQEAEKEKLREALKALDEKGLSPEKIAGRLWAIINSRENREKVGKAFSRARDKAVELVESLTGKKGEKAGGMTPEGKPLGEKQEKDAGETAKKEKEEKAEKEESGSGGDLDRIVQKISDDASEEINRAASRAADAAADAAADKAKEVVSEEIDRTAESIKNNLQQ